MFCKVSVLGNKKFAILWDCEGQGFGTFNFWYAGDQLIIDDEHMGRENIMAALKVLVDEAVLARNLEPGDIEEFENAVEIKRCSCGWKGSKGSCIQMEHITNGPFLGCPQCFREVLDVE